MRRLIVGIVMSSLAATFIASPALADSKAMSQAEAIKKCEAIKDQAKHDACMAKAAKMKEMMKDKKK